MAPNRLRLNSDKIRFMWVVSRQLLVNVIVTDALLSVSLSCPLQRLHIIQPGSLLRLWRYINPLPTYFLRSCSMVISHRIKHRTTSHVLELLSTPGCIFHVLVPAISAVFSCIIISRWAAVTGGIAPDRSRCVFEDVVFLMYGGGATRFFVYRPLCHGCRSD